MDEKQIKEVVKEKYSQIVLDTKNTGGCGCGCGHTVEYSVFTEDYSKLEGYVPEADLALGCGLPTEFAGIKEGDVVVDLGSGAGNDVFVARGLTGKSGRVIGIDMTPEMIEKAEKNNAKLKYDNVEFYLGEIESMPLAENTADVVISNCVLNLVPDKSKAFKEINRILKPGGHFCISDIVLKGILPAPLQKSAEMYAGCISGALQQEEYLDIINNTGFEKIDIKKSKEIILPDENLTPYLSKEEIEVFRNSEIGIYSITVVGYKR